MVGTVPFDALVEGAVDPESRPRSPSCSCYGGRYRSRKPTQQHGATAEAPTRATRFQGRPEALLLAIRAALAMLLLSGFWMATGWSEGFTAVSGGAIMLFFGVNQDNPLAGARSYLIWSTVGTLIAYLAIVFVLPYLQDFEALAAVLLLILLPAGVDGGDAEAYLGGHRAGRLDGGPDRPSGISSSRMNLPWSTASLRWYWALLGLPRGHRRDAGDLARTERAELAARDRLDPSGGDAR